MIISFRPLIRVNLCKHKFYIAMDDGAKVSVPLSGLIFVNPTLFKPLFYAALKGL